MNPIQRALLRAKHWEIFALWLVVSLFFDVAIDTVAGNPPFSLTKHAADSFLGRLLKEGDGLVLYAWAYFTGSFLNSVLPVRFRLRPAVFLLALAVQLTLGLMPRSWWSTTPPIALAVFLLFLICCAYLVRFPSKTLVIAERQQLVPFSGYANEFLLAFFFPIGIWFLQPRINDLYAAHESPADPGSPHQAHSHLPI